MHLQLARLFVLSTLLFGFSSSLQCPAPPPGHLYSKKTSYEVVANLDTNIPKQREGCAPVLYWSLVRHGTRYASGTKSYIEDMLGPDGLRDKLLKARNSKLCPKQKEDLRKWQLLPGVKIENEKKLTDSGRKEQRRMGLRAKKRMPLFFSKYKKEEFLVIHSEGKERTKSSSKEFMSGMFPGVNVILDKENAITRFYDNCPKWETEVKQKNKREKFKTSAEYKQLLSDLRDHLGVDITKRHQELIYDTCRFEMAWIPNKTSPWCNILTHQQIQLLNFSKDLRYYYLNGYGNKLNQEVACPALNDFLTKAEEKVSSSISSSPKAALYFSHSETLMMLLSALGLFKDSTDLSFAQHGNNRQWNSSNISPFAANLALVLLKCEKNDDLEEYYVETLHNERKVVIEECGEDCTWDNFNKIFDKFKKCDHEKTCALSHRFFAPT